MDEEQGIIVYDNALDVDGQPTYHYAESTSDGYIDPAEYEQPKTPQTFHQHSPPEDRSIPSVMPLAQDEYPQPPRRFSAVPASMAKMYEPPPPEPPKPPSIESMPNRRSGRNPLIGAVGLLGLVGLLGVMPSSESGPSTAASTGSTCLVGTVIWSASSSVPAGYRVADGSAVAQAEHPALFAAVGPSVPDLVGRYPRGGLEPGGVLAASVDAASLSVAIDDPGHAHIDAAGSTVLRDGRYALAHLYTCGARLSAHSDLPADPPQVHNRRDQPQGRRALGGACADGHFGNNRGRHRNAPRQRRTGSPHLHRNHPVALCNTRSFPEPNSISGI